MSLSNLIFDSYLQGNQSSNAGAPRRRRRQLVQEMEATTATQTQTQDLETSLPSSSQQVSLPIRETNIQLFIKNDNF